MELTEAKKSLTAAMCAVLLSCIGISLPYPILAPYFIEVVNPLTSFAHLPPKFLLGLALAVYPLGVLIGSSIIGAASDLWGRKTVLTVTLFVSAIGYAGTIAAFVFESYPLLIFTRLLTGFCEGNISVAKAIAADLSPVLDKTRTFSLINATGYAGWLIGPLIGGLLQPLGIDFVFTVALVMTLVSVVSILFLLPTDTIKSEQSLSMLGLIGKQNAFALLKDKAITHLFIIYFLATLGLNAYYAFYPLLLNEVFGFSSQEIGFITVVLTTFMILTSVFFVNQIKNSIGIVQGTQLGLIMLTLGLFTHLFVNASLLWPYYALMGICIALFNSFLPVYLSDTFSHIKQGQLMGLITTTFSLANVVIAIIGSLIAIINTTWAIGFGGSLALISAWLFYRHRVQTAVTCPKSKFD